MASITTLAQVVIWMFWLFLSNFSFVGSYLLFICAPQQLKFQWKLI